MNLIVKKAHSQLQECAFFILIFYKVLIPIVNRFEFHSQSATH